MKYMYITRILRRVAILGGVVALAGSAACAAPTDEQGDPEDEPTAGVSQASTSDGPCSIGGEGGQHFTFANGRFHVCWVHNEGPLGSRDNRYTLYDAFGPTQRIKLDLNNWSDTECKTTRYGAILEWEEAGTRFSGKPSGVKHC